MFKDTIRFLHQLEGMQVSTSVGSETDADGNLDRQCPGKECEFDFKINAGDWRDKVRDEEVFCPFCGHTADTKQWFTHEQVERAKKEAVARVKSMLGDTMRADARRWNQSQRSGFIKIKMDVRSGPRELLLPVALSEPMRLKIACPACECRYAVVGSAFFCPACGHNAAERVFVQSLGTIRASLDALPLLRQAISDRDTAENTCRLLIEAGLQNAVTAFQRFAEALLSRHPNPPKTRRNAFQNLAEGSEVWQTIHGTTYHAHVSDAELSTLSKYFQQRHLLAHQQGLVDADYLSRTADATYRIGQRLVIREAAVRECVDLIERLTRGMARDAARVSQPEEGRAGRSAQ